MHGYNDYMLLLRPDEHISFQIGNFKAFAANIIGDYPSMHSAAHISIKQYPRQKQYVIKPAMESLERNLNIMRAIRLQINNFRFFATKDARYTIYAVIEPTYKSDEWFSTLCKHMHINKKQLVPHITVVRTIDENSFLRLWPHFRYKVFRDSFLVTHFTILERETLNTRAKWQIYRDIKFRPLEEDSIAI